MAIMQDPAIRAAAVTPSDSTDLGDVRGLYIGGAGDVAIRAKGNDAAVTHVGVTAGSYMPIRAQYVYSTGTTATNIVAWY